MQNKRLGTGLNHYVIKNGSPLLADSNKINEFNKAGYIKINYSPAAVWLGVPLKSEGQCIGAIVVRDYDNKIAYNEDDLQLLTFVSAQVAQAIERRRSSEAIQTYAKELQLLNQTKDKFFSIIAHDLKNPFITILGFSELLHTDFNELSDEEKLYYIEEMKKSAETSHNLLQNLLQWSRSQTGRIDFNPADISIDELIFQNIVLLTPTAERKNISINYTADKNNHVFADNDMIDTVIRNLISNAIKFTNRDGKISISTDSTGPLLKVSVKDNGTGMSKEVKEKLFRLDVNQSTAGTDNETGTGLGLILCKEFIQKNGGTISVESEEGSGTTFSIMLPGQLNSDNEPHNTPIIYANKRNN